MDRSPSFLKARDPSIISWNRPRIDPTVRLDLFSKLEESDELSTSEDPSDKKIKTYLRVKPSTDFNDIYKVNKNVLLCKIPEDSYLFRKIKDKNLKKQYLFSKIYGPDVGQTELFNDCVKPSILNFINGQNGTLFTYGASGSGKTYTILGTTDEPGVIPRSLEYIFRSISTVNKIPSTKPQTTSSLIYLDKASAKAELEIKNSLLKSTISNKSTWMQTYKSMQERLSTESSAIIDEYSTSGVDMWVSFAEIYNEYIYDLLTPEVSRNKQRPKLQLGLDSAGRTYIKELKNVHVSSGLEAYELLQYGMQYMNYASTAVNSHSSRSHCIFTVKLLQALNKDKIQISHYNFCDLAGSERLKNTSNIGDRLKESNSINTSLHVLGRCVKSIQEGQKFKDSRIIPFRDSKLTRLFQPALSGAESIAIIINMNTEKAMFDESQHVLNFSSTAQDILFDCSAKPTLVDNKNSRLKISHSSLKDIDESEADTSEIETLREQVVVLSQELDHRTELWKEQEKEIRTQLVSHFQKRMDEMAASYEAQMTDYEKRYKTQSNRGAKRPYVIDLDSSTEESDVDELKAKLTKTENELSELREKYDILKSENVRLKSIVNCIKQDESYKENLMNK